MKCKFCDKSVSETTYKCQNITCLMFDAPPHFSAAIMEIIDRAEARSFEHAIEVAADVAYATICREPGISPKDIQSRIMEIEFSHRSS